MPKTIIVDVGGVLLHLAKDWLCESLAAHSSLSPDVVRTETANGPMVLAFNRFGVYEG